MWDDVNVHFRVARQVIGDIEPTNSLAIEKMHNSNSAKPFKWTKPASNIIAAVGRAKHALHN